MALYGVILFVASVLLPPFPRVARFFAENEEKLGAKFVCNCCQMCLVCDEALFLHFGNGCEIPLLFRLSDQEEFGTRYLNDIFAHRKEHSP